FDARLEGGRRCRPGKTVPPGGAARRDPEPAAAVCLLAGTRWRHPRKDAGPVGEIRPVDRTLARRAASEPQQPAQPPRDDDAAYHAAGARVSAVRPATALPP